MTLDQLEMIEAIVSEGSYQKAAKKIFKSQPSLSNGVKKIEEFYNIKIFSREEYRPKLTDQGKKFFQEAKMTLDSFRNLQKLALELSMKKETEVRLSIDPMVGLDKISRYLSVMQQDFTRTKLKIESGVLNDNLERILKGSADIAIGYKPFQSSRDVESRKITHIKLIPVVNKKLLKGKRVTRSDLNKIPNIIVATSSNEYDENISSLKWDVDSHARKVECINLGYGWGRVSLQQYKDNKELIKIPRSIVEEIELEIYIMKNKLAAHGPIVQKLWSLGIQE